MSNSKNLDLSALIPGFDMFKQMAGQIPGMGKGASLASNPFMPKPGNWIAPTLSVEELDKRITELQTVKLWLENNARLIEATTQALQVQKMTLSTLQEMKVNLGKVWPGMGAADPASSSSATGQAPSKSSRGRSKTHFDLGASTQSATTGSSHTRQTTTQPAEAAKPAAKPDNKQAQRAATKASADSSAAMQLASQQAMQMWQGLTQQFGQIATQVMQDSQAAAEKITARQQPAASARSRARKQTVAPATKTQRTTAAKTPTKPASKTQASRTNTRTSTGASSSTRSRSPRK